MESPFRLLYTWIVDAYHETFDLFVVNLLWALLTIPVVTAPPAAAALYYATNRIAQGTYVNWRTFMEGFRLFFWMGWRWALLNLLIISVLVSNYIFYLQQQLPWSGWGQWVMLIFAILWYLLQVYTFPLLIEQKDRRLRTALRNSMVLYLRRTVLALSTAVLIAAWLYLCTRYLTPAWLIITPSLAAYLANRAAIAMLGELVAEQPPKTEPK